MMNTITKHFLTWYKKNSRPLPWRETNDPYKIWVSEIFLQQTQAVRVIEYYNKTLQKFPTVFDLANASWEEFFPYFKGLGFYSRGKNMLKAAKYVVHNWNGKFSNNPKILQDLPGVGKYTAAAIASFAFGKNIPALDTNLYRVMGRFFGIEKEKEIEEASEYFYSSKKGNLLNHAFMDLGSSLCTSKKVQCAQCPLQNECKFFLSGKKIEKNQKKLKKITALEFSVCVLHHEKKYFVMQKDILLSQNCENRNDRNHFNTHTEGKKFPVFFNPEKKNHRHYLKEKILKKFGIEISIRPPFTEKIFPAEDFPELENPKKIPLRFRFSRCQIQGGKISEFLKSQQKNFYTPKTLEKFSFDTIIDNQLRKKIIQMRI